MYPVYLIVSHQSQSQYNNAHYDYVQELKFNILNGKKEGFNLLYCSNDESEERKMAIVNIVMVKEQRLVSKEMGIDRTYTIFKIKNGSKHENADICDDSTCCQAWVSKEKRFERWEEQKRESNWLKIEKAVNETAGKIVTYNGKPINAFFHANSGGTTELPVNVWGGAGLPYLQVVETAGEEGYTQYSSEVILNKEELIEKLKTKYSDIQIDFNNTDDIKILDYTDGSRVKTVKFGNHELSGVETRTILGLKSTNFEITKENDNIKFSVKGYGHGVGMSQWGAEGMAKEGFLCYDILKHYYTGVDIKDLY